MRHGLRRFYAVSALAGLIAILVTMALLQPIIGTQADFSIYNGRWNGASQVGRDLYDEKALLPALSVTFSEDQVNIAHQPLYEVTMDPSRGSLLLMGPSRAPDAREAAWLRGFVERGGRVLLADDFGAGNAFLEAMGVGTRIEGGLMLDLSFAKRPEFVVSPLDSPHPLTEGAQEAVLDYPTALLPGPNATILAQTSTSSWIDRNGNVYRDGDDPSGPFPWIALEPAGAGEVLILSDPSLLINGMRTLGDNDRLARNLVGWLSEGDRLVVVDESHLEQDDPLRLLGVRLKAVPPALRVGLALSAMGLVSFFALGRTRAWTIRPLRGLNRLVERLRPPPPEATLDVVQAVMRKHPDWDESALKQIKDAWNRP